MYNWRAHLMKNCVLFFLMEKLTNMINVDYLQNTFLEGAKIMNKDLTKMEKEMLLVLYKYSSFDLSVLELSYLKLLSYDKVLLAMQISSMFKVELLKVAELFVMDWKDREG